jgi:hypothetical protein
MNYFLIALWVAASALLFISMGSTELGLAFAFTLSILSAFTVIADKFNEGEL